MKLGAMDNELLWSLTSSSHNTSSSRQQPGVQSNICDRSDLDASQWLDPTDRLLISLLATTIKLIG